MKLIIRVLKILCGVGFLAIAIGGAVGWCFSSLAAFKQMVVYGTPVGCPFHGTEVQVPGRLVAAVVIGVPIFAFLGAWHLLTSAFDNPDERGPSEND